MNMTAVRRFIQGDYGVEVRGAVPRKPHPAAERARQERQARDGRHRSASGPSLGMWKLWSVISFCLLVLAGCGGAVPVRTVDVESLVRDVETKSYLVQRFQADFVQTRRTPVFDRDLTVRGTLIFEKPNRFQLSLSGDVNVEILSDGHIITLIHDGKDQETFVLKGERDLSRFADPLMVLLQSIGNGGLRTFSVVRNLGADDSVLLEATPTGQLYFERTKKVVLQLSSHGEIGTVSLDFGEGNRDETVFSSWSMLAQDDPAIVRLHSRLEALSHHPATGADEPPLLGLSPERKGQGNASVNAPVAESLGKIDAVEAKREEKKQRPCVKAHPVGTSLNVFNDGSHFLSGR